MAVASIAATLDAPAAAIDHDMARSLHGSADGIATARPSGLAVLLTSPLLLVFAASATLFHFVDRAMLPLIGQKPALANPDLATTLMSASIVAAQLVMVPVALVVGAADDPYWLVGVQLLDGVGAGIFGTLFPLIVADLTAGTGHFNVARGAIATAQGIGARHLRRRRDRRRRWLRRSPSSPSAWRPAWAWRCCSC